MNRFGFGRVSLIMVLWTPLAAWSVQADTWKWDPKKKCKSIVGERIAEESSFSNDQKLEVPGVNSQSSHIQVKIKSIREVLAIGQDGKTVMKARIKCESFEFIDSTSGTDTSLTGKSFLLKREGDKMVLEFEDPSGISDQAKTWAMGQYTTEEKYEDKFEIMLPNDPVAPGSEWMIDSAKVCEAMFPGTGCDTEKSIGEGRLTGVRVSDDKHVGKLELQLKLQLKKVPGNQAEWKTGGRLEISLSHEGELGGVRAPGTSSMSLKMEGTADLDTRDGKKTPWVFSMAMTQTAKRTIVK